MNNILFFQIIILMSALVAVAKSGLAPVAAPVVAAAKVVDTEFDPNPQYTYAYDVQDSITGDSKNQFETRDGDIVRGRYSLIEADGTRRIVDYTADPVNGFNAVVQREPAVVKAAVVAPAPVAKFVAAPAPVAKFVAAPAPFVAQAPVAKFVAPAPLVAKYAAAPYAQYVSAAPVAPVPAIAKVAAPLLAAPFARYATPVAYPYAKVVAPAPVAKFAAPLSYPAPVAYTAPVAAPFAKFVSPFGAYNVL